MGFKCSPLSHVTFLSDKIVNFQGKVSNKDYPASLKINLKERCNLLCSDTNILCSAKIDILIEVDLLYPLIIESKIDSDQEPQNTTYQP